jgi:hypothetical protein
LPDIKMDRKVVSALHMTLRVVDHPATPDVHRCGLVHLQCFVRVVGHHVVMILFSFFFFSFQFLGVKKHSFFQKIIFELGYFMKCYLIPTRTSCVVTKKKKKKKKESPHILTSYISIIPIFIPK